MNNCFLLIGGNEGNSVTWLALARENIELSAGKIILASAIYQTAAWGKTDQSDFLNQALRVETSLAAPALMAALLEIEEKMGRRRGEKWGSRIIDIDILFFNDEIIALPQLSIPHPEIQNRRFALAPMAEIAPEWIHPVIGKSVSELLNESTDRGNVKKIPFII